MSKRKKETRRTTTDHLNESSSPNMNSMLAWIWELTKCVLIKKWLCCLLAMYSGTLSPVESVTVRTPPTNPSTIEAQAKFFQDFFSVQLSPYKIEFGHVCEDPNTWEQRYEKKDFKNHRDMGKVRWGDKKGGYGEHYWDLNHAGHAGNHGHDDYDSDSDDGSYKQNSYDHEPDHSSYSNDHSDDPYDEPSEESPKYETTDYEQDKSPKYEEIERTKRAHPRMKTERKIQVNEDIYEEDPQQKKKKVIRRHKEHIQAAPSHNIETVLEEDNIEEVQKKPVKLQRTQQQQNQQDLEDQSQLQSKQTDLQEETSQQSHTPKKTLDTHYVPYERGAGVRQHYPEATISASVPRLFLEPSTGHVIDRATGQAYVLQPVQPIIVG